MPIKPSTNMTLEVATADGKSVQVEVTETAARQLKDDLVLHFREFDRAQKRVADGGIKRPRAVSLNGSAAE